MYPVSRKKSNNKEDDFKAHLQNYVDYSGLNKQNLIFQGNGPHTPDFTILKNDLSLRTTESLSVPKANYIVFGGENNSYYITDTTKNILSIDTSKISKIEIKPTKRPSGSFKDKYGNFLYKRVSLSTRVKIKLEQKTSFSCEDFFECFNQSDAQSITLEFKNTEKEQISGYNFNYNCHTKKYKIVDTIECKKLVDTIEQIIEHNSELILNYCNCLGVKNSTFLVVRDELYDKKVLTRNETIEKVKLSDYQGFTFQPKPSYTEDISILESMFSKNLNLKFTLTKGN